MAQAKIGDIYELRICSEQFYIGSTKDFEQRRTNHLLRSKTENFKVYKAIRANNGVFEMNLLYQIEYYNDVELRMAEREAYDELKPTLNTNRPYISDEEAKEYNRYNSKKNYQENKAAACEYGKEYYIKNKNNIAELKKVYYNNNKDARCEYGKEYYNNNKDARCEASRDYYNNNKDIIAEKSKQKADNNRFICGCGSNLHNKNSEIQRHYNSKKHKKWVNNN